MNEKQLIVMWVGIIIIVLMGLFPPWLTVFADASRISLGYGFILIPPLPNAYRYQFASIDFTRLLTQWTIVAAITAGLIITFKDKKTKDKGEQKQ